MAPLIARTADRRDVVQAEGCLALHPQLRSRVLRGRDLDGTHGPAPVGLFELHQGIGKRCGVAGHAQAEDAGLGHARLHHLLAPAGALGHGPGSREAPADLGLEPHANDPAAEREDVLHVGAHGIVDVLVVAQLPHVARAGPVALGAGRAAVRVELQAQSRQVVLPGAGEDVDVVAALPAGHVALADEAAADEAAEQPVGDERVAVAAGVDDSAAPGDPEDPEQMEDRLLTLGAGHLGARTPVVPPAQVQGAVHVDRAKLRTGRRIPLGERDRRRLRTLGSREAQPTDLGRPPPVRRVVAAGTVEVPHAGKRSGGS